MAAGFENIRVTTYAGYRADETPRELEWGARRLRVSEVLARWREPEAELFEVRLEDGSRLCLRRDASSGAWSAAAPAGG